MADAATSTVNFPERWSLSLFLRSTSARFALGLIVISLAPSLVGGKFAYSLGAEVAIYALALMGLNILYGWAGQISLAHAGFFGLGAYLAALLQPWTGDLVLGPVYEIIAVIAVAATAGVIVGLPAARLSGLQLSILTLAFAEVFQWALNHFTGISGGSQGIIVNPLKIGPYSTLNGEFRFFLSLAFVAAGGFLLLALQKTPLARAMYALRDTELAARSVGVSLTTVKLTAFVLGSVYAAVAGWLFAYHAFAVTPGHFSLFANVFMLLAIVIGGRFSILGAWIGAIYLVVVPELVRSIGSGNLYPILSGAILIAVVLLAPRGFADLIHRWASSLHLYFRRRMVSTSRLNVPQQRHTAGGAIATKVGPRRSAPGPLDNRLEVKDISLSYGGLAALSGVRVEFSRGISGLIGPNGAGKTTLLNVISGLVHATEGTINLNGNVISTLSASQLARLGVVRSFQTVRLLDDETVLTNILLGRYRVSSKRSFQQALRYPSLLKRERVDYELSVQMARALGLEHSDLNRRAREIPFGARRLVEIGRVLVSDPRVVLLDEPASGLTALEREHLRTFLQGYVAERSTIMVLTEHDVDLVRSLCRHIVVLEAGRVVTTGRPADVFANAEVKKAYFGEGR